MPTCLSSSFLSAILLRGPVCWNQDEHSAPLVDLGAVRIVTKFRQSFFETLILFYECAVPEPEIVKRSAYVVFRQLGVRPVLEQLSDSLAKNLDVRVCLILGRIALRQCGFAACRALKVFHNL